MIRKMEHVAIIVTDMDQTINYFSQMFGFKLRLRGEIPNRELAFLYLDNQRDFEIELVRILNADSGYAAKGIVNHLAFTVDNIDEAMDFYRAKGIQFNADKPTISADGGKAILFYGPNQELLQLVEPGVR